MNIAMENTKSKNEIIKLDSQLMELIKQEQNITHLKICFFLSHLHFPEISLEDYRLRKSFACLPANVKAIVEETRGQLIFKTQAYKFINYATNVGFDDAKKWVIDWNRKRVQARSLVNELSVEGFPLLDIIQLLSPFKEHYFFIDEPIYDAKKQFN
jgi:hypothetical protein